MKISILAHAQRQLERKISWWDGNRPASRVRVETAFEKTVSEIKENPELGQKHPRRPRFRSWPLKGTPYRVFYRFEENDEHIIIADVWSTQQGRGPRLK